jgi:hypothetical protein
VITYSYNGGTNQKWCMEPAEEGGYFHPSYDTNLCMDVPNSNFVTNQVIQLWSCNGTPAHRWSVASDQPISPYSHPELSLADLAFDQQTKLTDIWPQETWS